MIKIPPDEASLLGLMMVCGYRPGHGGEPLSDHCRKSCRILWLISRGCKINEVMKAVGASWDDVRVTLRAYHERRYPVIMEPPSQP